MALSDLVEQRKTITAVINGLFDINDYDLEGCGDEQEHNSVYRTQHELLKDARNILISSDNECKMGSIKRASERIQNHLERKRAVMEGRLAWINDNECEVHNILLAEGHGQDVETITLLSTAKDLLSEFKEGYKKDVKDINEEIEVGQQVATLLLKTKFVFSPNIVCQWDCI